MAAARSLNLAAAVAFLITAAAWSAGAAAYTNHTVGAAAGWAFNATTNTSATNYSSWASRQSFGLGDYLIFNTNTNQTVLQTYNLTTFMNCTADESSDNDTFIYNGGNSTFGAPQTVAVPLTIEGTNYFFSDADDGVQCQHGMAFAVNVTRGLGLPPSLNQPPPPPYKEPPPADSTGSVEAPQQTGGASVSGAGLRGVICYFLLVLSGGSVLVHFLVV